MSARVLDGSMSLCNGDGAEAERLYALRPGHVLTAENVEDIQNLIADYNDEIGNSVEILYNAYQQALLDAVPDKVELLNRVDELSCELVAQKALNVFYMKCAEMKSGKQQDTRN